MTGDDLSISAMDVLLGMRYNNMLLGPRGILVDYISNTGQLFMKALADPFLPETGGMDPRARATITAVEYAAIGKFFPLMMQRISGVILNGVTDLQAAQAGTPHSISGKIDRKMEDALADRDYYRVGKLALAQMGTVGFLEAAGRMKSVADVAINTLAFGMEQARQAGVMAWREGQHPVGSDAWYRRVAEIMDNPPAQMVRNSYREAERTTYQGQMGTIGRKLEAIQKHPIGQFALPFLRALYHIRGWAIDYSPVGAMGTLGDVIRAQIPADSKYIRPLDRAAVIGLGAATGAGLGSVSGPVGAAIGGLAGGAIAARHLGDTQLAGGPYRMGYKGAGVVGHGVADLDRRMFANMIGTAAFTWMLWYAFAEGISGSGPPDEPIIWLEDDEKPDFNARSLANTMRARGWRPYSIRVPWFNGEHYWVSYSNWGPLGYLLAGAAAIAEAHKYGLSADKKDPNATFLGKSAELVTAMMAGDMDVARTAARRFFGVVSDMSYMQGLVDLYKLGQTAVALGFDLHPPDETSSQAIKRQRQQWAQIREYTGNIATSFIPASGLLTTIAQSQDPSERATERGDIKQMAARRIPELGYPLPPSIAPPYPDATSLTQQTLFGSATGRREGLPVQHDVLGREEENPYAGVYAWLPFRAAREDLSSPTLQALIDADVGLSSPPTELYYKPHQGTDSQGRMSKSTGKPVMVQIPQRARQELATTIGTRVDARVQELLRDWPEERRKAEPDAWRNLVKEEIKGITFKAQDEFTENTVNQVLILQPLSQDSSHVRPWEKRPDANPSEVDVPDISAPEGTATPAATPSPGATPRPGAARTPTPAPTPTPSVGPETPAQRLRRQAEERERQRTPVPAR